jgi:uncharacterized glyoxalase superfamily protein PhnB
MAKAQPVPAGFNTVSAYLVVPNSREALAFYKKAFAAEEVMCMPGPDGKTTMHAEMRIGNSTVMLGDENPEWGSRSPLTLGGAGVSLHLYVDNADALFQRAVSAGCTPIMPMMDAFWGDRYGKLKDPFGHQWGVATHKEDVTPQEMGKRAEAFFASMAAQPGGKA